MRIKFPLTLWLATCLSLPFSAYAEQSNQETAPVQPATASAQKTEAAAADSAPVKKQPRSIRRQKVRHARQRSAPVRPAPVKSAPVKPAPVKPATPPAQKEGNPSATDAKTLPQGWQEEQVSLKADDPQKTRPPTAKGAVPVPQGNDTDAAGGLAAAPSSVSKIFLPLGNDAGIAGFWSQNDFIIVSDHPTQMDTSALNGQKPFDAASAQVMGDTTLVVFHFDHPLPLEMHKQPGGWVLALQEGNSPSRHSPLISQPKDGGILFPMSRAGRVVEISDPATGARLLVATAADEFAGPNLRRHLTGYEIWPSAQGLVFAAESDQIEVRKGENGAFLDVLGKDGIPTEFAASGGVSDDRVDWSWLGLRALAPTVLREDYRRQWTKAAMLPPEQRAEARLSAARAAFAMGDTRETNAILSTAVSDNPELAIQPNVIFLRSAAQLLNGDVADASALENPDVGADGIFWHGLYLARKDTSPEKAASFLAQGYGNLLGYPEPLRKELQPEVATFIAQHGSDEDRTVIAPLPATHDYDLARAFLALRDQDQERALGMFTHLASDRNAAVAARAGEQMTGLKLALGRIRPAEAASRYESLLLGARLAGTEKEVRQDLLGALMQSGQWQKAMIAADEAIVNFPDLRTGLIPQMQEILTHLASGEDASQAGSRTGALVDDVAMIESHIDQIPDSPVKGGILVGLGRKLQSLGLSGKAAIAFERALPLADSDTSRALWGAELARADIAAQRLGQARRALDETRSPQADASLASNRRIIEAGLLIREGSKDQALQLLAQDENDEALDMRGQILEDQHKWPDAVMIVGRLATKNLPETGPLGIAQQDLTIRLATDAARANDWATLDRLREWIGGRSMTPERQHVFNLLVTSPEAELQKRAPTE